MREPNAHLRARAVMTIRDGALAKIETVGSTGKGVDQGYVALVRGAVSRCSLTPGSREGRSALPTVEIGPFLLAALKV